MVQISKRPSVFEFRDYKAYLKAWISSRPNSGRGEKSRIAKQAQCHLAYVSQVLTRSSHFNLEQAEALGGLLEHNDEEAHFFLLLVEYARAGTLSLRTHFERRIQKILDQRLQIKNRLTNTKTLSLESQATYYSHWAYVAVHMAVLVPSLRTPGEIAKYFDLSLRKTQQVLEFLTTINLVKRKGGLFFPGDVWIHLSGDSPMISKQQTNWRLEAIKSLDRESPHQLHYSAVISVSKADLPKIQELMIQTVEQIRAITKASQDETVYCYNLDFFGLGRE